MLYIIYGPAAAQIAMFRTPSAHGYTSTQLGQTRTFSGQRERESIIVTEQFYCPTILYHRDKEGANRQRDRFRQGRGALAARIKL